MNQRNSTEAGELKMIKSLFEESEEQSDQNKTEKEEINNESTIVPPPAPQYVEVNESEDLIEHPTTVETVALSDELNQFDEIKFESLIEKINNPDDFGDRQADSTLETVSNLGDDEIENQLETNSNGKQFDETNAEPKSFSFVSEFPTESTNQNSLFRTFNEEEKNNTSNDVSASSVEPQSLAETARQSGLAYAAAITLFASVVFMLIIGWFADLLFESSPWGKVGGIVIGSLIGFIQLFRITSQIFKNKN